MLRQFIGYGTLLAIVCSSAPPALALQQQVQIQSTTQLPDMNGMQFLPPGRTAKTGTGRIRGRVVAADTGSVLRRAQVRISSPDIGTRTALTDAQGRYEFRDLPAGRFNVSVSKSGFVTMQYGQNRPFEPGRPIELVDAQVIDKADLALPRGSVLAGRIIDEFGEAVAEANVTAMRMQYTGGRRRLVPSGRNSMTNDLGQFRLYGLPPGEYYVSASLRTLDNLVMDILGANNGGPTGSNNNTGYAATYYPGTPNPAEAQRIAVAVGQELPSVDIQLQPVRLAKITGVATSSDGKPMSGALVMLIPAMKDAMQMFPGGTSRTNKDGQFTLNGVAPGEYTLQAQSLNAIMSAAGQAMSIMSGGDSAPATPPPSAAEREFAMTSVTVAGEDITGLVVVGTRGARASGRIVFDGGVAPEGMAQARLLAVQTDPDSNGPATAAFGNATIKENGTFEIDGLVGGRTFRFANPPKGWHVKRILLDAEDVTDKGIDFKPGEDVAGLTIEMTNKNQSVEGAVTDARGEPSKDYTVVVFPQDQQKWTLAVNRYLQTARPDQSGHYKIANVPPGEYYAVAVEYVAQGDWNDPEWLTRASRSATRFAVQEGETKTLDLKLSGS